MKKNLCWWCGNLADSGEHKFKRTDIKNLYGDGPFAKNDKVAVLKMNTDSNPVYMQSSNSSSVKFRKNLCKNCNNARSQKFDLAYERFINYIDKNLEQLKGTLELDFEEIYGMFWKKKKKHLLGYFVKHIACNLESTNLKISRNIIEFLNDDAPLKDINILFQIKSFYLLLEDGHLNSLSTGPIMGYDEREEGVYDAVLGWYNYKQFTINYVYRIGVISDLFVCEDEFLAKQKHTIQTVDYSRLEGQKVDISSINDYINTYNMLDMYHLGEDLSDRTFLEKMISYSI